MPITHVISVKYTPSATAPEKASVFSRFMELKTISVREDGTPLVLTLVGGDSNVSTQGLGKDYDVSVPFAMRTSPCAIAHGSKSKRIILTLHCMN